MFPRNNLQPFYQQVQNSHTNLKEIGQLERENTPVFGRVCEFCTNLLFTL
jgi:hypothetical protein